MNIRNVFALAALTAIAAMPAWAVSPREVMEQLAKCSELKDSAQRLACYDALAPQMRESLAAAKKPAERTEADKQSLFGWDFGGVFGSNEGPTTPEEFGKNQMPQPAPEEGEVIDSINATVTEYAMTPLGKFIVFLDNGQVWRQLDADTRTVSFLHEAKANKVVIERGFLSSYNLKLNDQSGIFKVKRIK